MFASRIGAIILALMLRMWFPSSYPTPPEARHPVARGARPTSADLSRRFVLQSRLIAIADLMQNGHLAEAERACRTLLAQFPQQATALHLLGLIREQSGDAAAGDSWCGRACKSSPPT